MELLGRDYNEMIEHIENLKEKLDATQYALINARGRLLELRKACKKRNEKSSKRLASLAGRALKDPKSVSLMEIKELAGCVLTQVEGKV